MAAVSAVLLLVLILVLVLVLVLIFSLVRLLLVKVYTSYLPLAQGTENNQGVAILSALV